MGELESFFFDSYAFYEVIKGNPNYKKYEKGIDIITTKLNLMEFHYGLLKLYGNESADKYYNLFLPYTVEIEDATIRQANEFKLLNKSLKLSYVDCIGYVIAKKLGVKFLTGDNGFRDMENVEFVK